MKYILFDSKIRETLKPLTYTRPVCDIRCGIMTIREKWETLLNAKTYTFTEDYLKNKYEFAVDDKMIFIDGKVIPTKDLVQKIINLNLGEEIYYENQLIAKCESEDSFYQKVSINKKRINYNLSLNMLYSLVSIFTLNGEEIQRDFDILTQGRQSATLSDTNRVIGKENIFVEEGAKIEFATLNAQEGPIYIGKDCQIMENAAIRGPFSMLDKSVIKMSAKIYGPVSLGPACKIGGEVEDCVFIGYSNKAHDGYFGNSVLGEWCNIGADSNTSNLKNTYDNIKLWSIEHSTFEPTGVIFCGTIMADHAKCGINTMFNTGTVIGVGSNVFGSGYQRNYIPSFIWGGTKGLRRDYDVEKVIKTAEIVEARRNVKMSEADKNILRYIYKITHSDRDFFE